MKIFASKPTKQDIPAQHKQPYGKKSSPSTSFHFTPGVCKQAPKTNDAPHEKAKRPGYKDAQQRSQIAGRK